MEAQEIIDYLWLALLFAWTLSLVLNEMSWIGGMILGIPLLLHGIDMAERHRSQ